MDLGLTGRVAVICASSHGLGRACATELARAGCTVVITGRSAATLERTAAEIVKPTAIIPIAVDISTQKGRDQVLDAAPKVDIPSTTTAVTLQRFPSGRQRGTVGRRSHEHGDTHLSGQKVIDGMMDRRFGQSSTSRPHPENALPVSICRVGRELD
jgi:3-oxoacyl-[acyl-carrier protein] reductase